MTQARMVFAQQTLHITSTTLQRMFLLRPDAVVNQILLYCLFRAAEKYGVLVHSVLGAACSRRSRVPLSTQPFVRGADNHA